LQVLVEKKIESPLAFNVVVRLAPALSERGRDVAYRDLLRLFAREIFFGMENLLCRLRKVRVGG